MLFALIGIPFTLTVIADLGKFARIKFTQNTFQYGFFYATGRVFATAVSAVGKKLPSLTSKFNVSCFKWKFFLSFSLSLFPMHFMATNHFSCSFPAALEICLYTHCWPWRCFNTIWRTGFHSIHYNLRCCYPFLLWCANTFIRMYNSIKWLVRDKIHETKMKMETISPPPPPPPFTITSSKLHH